MGVESAAPQAQTRLRALLRTIESVDGGQSLDRALADIVQSARDLTDADFATIGILGSDGAVDRYIPRGGVDRGAPSSLEVPIHAGDAVFGNLYLTSGRRGEFTEDDEGIVGSLAVAAGSAVSNARLYQELRLQQRWLEASADIGTQLLTAPDDDPLALIAQAALTVADADMVTISTLVDAGNTLVVEAAAGVGSERTLGEAHSLRGGSLAHVIAAGESVAFDGADLDPELFGSVAEVFAPGPTMILPLVGTGDVRGTVAMMRRAGRPSYTEADRSMAAAFASHASIALELADSRAAEQRMLLLEDRDRIAMDLHDHVIQELFAIGLGLESMATMLGLDHPMAERLVGRVDDVDRVIKRIRTSIFELRGAVTTGDSLQQLVVGIGAELRSVLGLTPTVRFVGSLGERVDAAFRDDVEACVRESLTNVAKHAQARTVSVDLVVDAGVLTVRVIDDGVGPAGATRSSGIANLRARAEKRGGSFRMAAGPRGGTVVTWRVPLRAG